MLASTDRDYVVGLVSTGVVRGARREGLRPPPALSIKVFPRMSHPVTSIGFRKPVPACLLALEPAGPAANLCGERISPAGEYKAGLLADAALQILPPPRSSAVLRPLAASR